MVSWNRMWLQLAAVVLYFGTRPTCSDPLMLVLRLQPIYFSNTEYYQHISSSNWHSNGHMFLRGFVQSFIWFTWRLVLRVVFSGVSNAIHVSIQDLLMNQWWWILCLAQSLSRFFAEELKCVDVLIQVIWSFLIKLSHITSLWSSELKFQLAQFANKFTVSLLMHMLIYH